MSRRNGAAPALRARDVSVSYGDTLAITGVNLDISSGRIVALVGPNGAGKTTLFKTLVGLLKPDTGAVEVLGEPLRRRGRQTAVAYVPQQGAVDPTYPVTVMDVVLMGRYGHVGWFRRPGPRDRDHALRALDRVGLTAFADRPIGALSGGQRQRVFLARALAQDAALLLMDEPFTGVDAKTQEFILDTLKLLRAEGRTILIATHDLASVRAFCDDCVLVNRTIVAQGPVDQVYTLENLQRAFEGRLVLLGGTEAVAVAAPVADEEVGRA